MRNSLSCFLLALVLLALLSDSVIGFSHHKFSRRVVHSSRCTFPTTRLQVASSLDPGDGVDTTDDATKDTTAVSTAPLVQRRYRTFRWKHDMQDYDINYRVEGPINGQPILLIHGFGANVNHFRHQFPALTDEGYRVYAIDLLGFGASPKPEDANYSIELFVQLATDFIQTMRRQSSNTDNTLEDKKWIVAGNSIGGLVSLGVAEALPNLIKGVVLFNCAGGMTGFRYSDVPVFVRPLLWFFQKVLLGPQMGSSFFAKFKTRDNVESILRSQGVYRDTTNVDDELLEILLGPADDEGAETVFLKTFAGDPGPTPEAILPNLECPVMAIWGESDPWTPVDGGMHPGNEFHEYSHDFELHTIPNCGHCPHDEAPEQVNSLMLKWLDGLEARKHKIVAAQET